MTKLAIDLVLFCCVLAFATGIVLSKAKRWPMTLTHFPEEAEYWRTLAREARHRAEQTVNARSRQVILKAAQTYHLRADQVAKGQGGTRIVSPAG
jgi:hypothetical protein